ncbi:MAG: nucleotide exchange factor GrpE [Kiritimatiellales bacterium]|nr:nucleotide exchange factor GrpE [Kiritimatiellota bacterium]MBL7011400.1 nucleotide exchange factor GrpE [Kiritimatiellales bacterium]
MSKEKKTKAEEVEKEEPLDQPAADVSAETSAQAEEADIPAEEAAQEDVELIEEEKEEEEPLRLQLMRLQADFDNFRKRQVRERAEWIVRANEDLFMELLPVLDHYEMGLKSAEEHQTDCSVTEGFKLVYNQLLDLLEKHNVTPVEAIGEAFNPHIHEALTHMPSDKPAETVIEQVRRGYRLGDKLLRAAQVVVSSGPVEEKDSE